MEFSSSESEISIEEVANLLPKATLNKLVSEIVNLPRYSHLKINIQKTFKTKLSEYGIIFLQLIIGESIDLINKENKKTITHDHILKVLDNLEFNEYLPILANIIKSKQLLLHKKQEKVMNFKNKNIALSQEELLAQQELLFKQSRNRLNNKE